MSIRSVCAYFLINNCVQDLPENELANMSATRECTSVEDRVMDTNSKAAVTATKERASVEPEDRVMETNPEAAVRGLIYIPPSL